MKYSVSTLDNSVAVTLEAESPEHALELANDRHSGEFVIFTNVLALPDDVPMEPLIIDIAGPIYVGNLKQMIEGSNNYRRVIFINSDNDQDVEDYDDGEVTSQLSFVIPDEGQGHKPTEEEMRDILRSEELV